MEFDEEIEGKIGRDNRINSKARKILKSKISKILNRKSLKKEIMHKILQMN